MLESLVDQSILPDQVVFLDAGEWSSALVRPQENEGGEVLVLRDPPLPMCRIRNSDHR